MAAKLKWKGNDLFLGAFLLASTLGGGGDWSVLLLPVHGRHPLESDRWQTRGDAQQDCESEVRRLLKEAGVEVEQ